MTNSQPSPHGKTAHARWQMEVTLIRFTAVASVLAFAFRPGMSPAPLHQADGVITQVRQACGVGQVRINAICMYRSTAR